jgi:hypothetical protein
MTTERVLCEVGIEAYEATVDINVSPFTRQVHRYKRLALYETCTRQVQENILGKIKLLRSSPLLKNVSALLNYTIILPASIYCCYGCAKLVSHSKGRI